MVASVAYTSRTAPLQADTCRRDGFNGKTQLKLLKAKIEEGSHLGLKRRVGLIQPSREQFGIVDDKLDNL